jgi:hypothetical protein
MAVGIRLKFKGMDAAQFDKINALVDPASNPPAGLIFHSAGPIDSGFRVIDFWETRADFDAFSARIMEAVQGAGIEMTGPPDVEEFPVHEVFAGS